VRGHRGGECIAAKGVFGLPPELPILRDDD